MDGLGIFLSHLVSVGESKIDIQGIQEVNWNKDKNIIEIIPETNIK